MSKLSFRARALDCGKQMPVFLAEELPDLSDYVTINRSVPQMPTGMEKEEEMELHLQQAITAQQASTVGADIPSNPVIIPTPKVTSDAYDYDRLYPCDFRLPKQLIRIQAALNLEPEYPDYDLDSEDEQWINVNAGALKLEITPVQFEKIMDTLEKQSEYQVISPDEAKLLLQEDDDVVFAVYDYWLNKRYKSTASNRRLIPRVRADKRDTVIAADPYVGFRRRAEKMQTRKNRKNDEESYEKILKLRHDLQKAVTLLEMVKRREKSKREMINLSLDLAQKRNDVGDINGELYNQLKQEVKPSFQFSREEMLGGKVRKTSKKRKGREDKDLVSREWLLENAEQWHKPELFPTTSVRSENDKTTVLRPDKESEEDADGPYSFKRRRGCVYHAPVEDKNDSIRCWPWEEPKPQFRYVHAYLHSHLMSSSSGLRYVGLVRRRVGRGGRIVFDRVNNPEDLPQSLPGEEDDLPSTSSETVVHRHPSLNQKEIPCFRPPSLNELHNSANVGNYSNSSWRSNRRGDGLSSSSSLDLLNANDQPLATLSGPNGNLDVRLKIGVTPSFYSIQRDQLAQNVVAHNVDRVASAFDLPSTSSTSSSHFSPSSKYSGNYEKNRFYQPDVVENGRIPYGYASIDDITVGLDSQKAFEATAAVMTGKQAQQLADHYQKNFPNNSSFSNNYNLSNSTSSSTTNNNNGPTSTATYPQTTATNGETNQTAQRLAIPPSSPSPAVERVLSQAVLLSSSNRCSKKYGGLDKLGDQELIIRPNLHFLSS